MLCQGFLVKLLMHIYYLEVDNDDGEITEDDDEDVKEEDEQEDEDDDEEDEQGKQSIKRY